MCSFLTNNDLGKWCRYLDIPCYHCNDWDIVVYPGYPCTWAGQLAFVWGKAEPVGSPSGLHPDDGDVV